MGRGYSSLADNLIKFNQLGELPFKLERLDDGNYGIEVTMVKNNAQYHQSCQLKYNNLKVTQCRKAKIQYWYGIYAYKVNVY